MFPNAKTEHETCWLKSCARCHPLRVLRLILVFGALVMLLRVFNVSFSALWRRTETSPSLIDYFAANVRLEYVFLDSSSEHRIRLTNTGDRDIPPGTGWTIYFSQVAKLYNKSREMRRLQKLEVRHVDSFLQSIQPIFDASSHSSFEGIPANTSLVLNVTLKLKSSSYAFPRWYIAGDSDTQPRVLRNTDTDSSLDFVQPFREEGSSERRFHTNQFDVGQAAQIAAVKLRTSIIPTPLKTDVTMAKSTVKIGADWVVVFEGQLKNEANYLGKMLGLRVLKGSPKEVRCIQLNVDDLRKLFDDQRRISSSSPTSADAYVVRVMASGVVLVVGQSASGVFYAVQSIIALFDVDDRTLPVVQIVDAPRFEYRGLMLDVARNFVGVGEVLRIVDVMAAYKMNRLHFHLTDDQGWRIEIPGLPELTEVGARRGHDPNQTRFLHPYFGSPPTGQHTASGYYSVDDYRSIVRYAAARHVVVIPEVDLPGHAHAAILSMRIRRRRLAERGEPEDVSGRYALDDPDDTSVYVGVNGQKDAVVNPCQQSTFRFVKHVISQLKKLHQDIQPLTVIHFGGDEVPQEALTRSPICQRLIKQQRDLRHNRLRLYFVRRVVAIASKLGLVAQFWEDGLTTSNSEAASRDYWDASTVYGQAWNNVPGYARGNLTMSFANAGYKVILSHATHLYLDQPNEADRNEMGLAWASSGTDTRRIFDYLPAGVHYNDDHSGNVSIHRICQVYNMTDCFPLTRPENIAGMESCLWSELIRTPEQLEYMLLPRLLAVAERAWHVGDWETVANDTEYNEHRRQDWMRFATILSVRELPRLEHLGLRYRLAPPGVLVTDDQLKVNVEFPSLPVYYSADDGQTWTKLTSSTLERDQSRDMLLVTRSFDSTRQSRPVLIRKSRVRHT